MTLPTDVNNGDNIRKNKKCFEYVVKTRYTFFFSDRSLRFGSSRHLVSRYLYLLIYCFTSVVLRHRLTKYVHRV